MQALFDCYKLNKQLSLIIAANKTTTLTVKHKSQPPNNYYYYYYYTHLNSLFSRTTWVSQYRRGKTSLDLNKARDSEWKWHQLDCMQTICTSLSHSRQLTKPTPHHPIFTCRMLFLTPNQQCHSSEGTALKATTS